MSSPPVRTILITGILFLFAIALPCRAEDPSAEQTAQPAKSGDQNVGTFTEEDYVDFQSPETFMDVTDALKSKQYIRRAILSTVVQSTNRMKVGKFYVNHLMGFNAILQRAGAYSKFVSGIQGIALGYVGQSGHGGELGLELSAVSNVFVGYRYFYRPEHFSIWLSGGVGVGMEMPAFSIARGPIESTMYTGSKQMFFGVASLMIPLVDVAFKAEVRFNFYGFDRLTLTQGIGAIIFI